MTSVGLSRPLISNPLSALVGASVLWAISQVAWRFGAGTALALAGQRAFVGGLLLSPVLVAAIRDGRLGRLRRSPVAMVAVGTGGLSMPFTATLFRELTGPQAALVSSVTPAIILLAGAAFAHRTTLRVAVAVVLATILASASAASGGLGHFSAIGLLAASILLGVGVVSGLAIERARNEGHDATVLVGAGMVVAAVGCYSLALSTQGIDAIPVSGFVAATVVGVLGTTARVLNGHAVPHVGSAVASAATHLTSLLTAIGGVALFADEIDAPSAVLGTMAALVALVAMTSARRDGRSHVASRPTS